MAVLAGTAACGRDRPAEPAAAGRICDGSDEVRLALRSAGGLRAMPEERAFYDVGWWFLVVDGQCRAWVATDASLTTRTAIVDEDALRKALLVDEWPAVAGTWHGAEGAGFEARLGDTKIRCDGGCDHPGTPKLVRRVRDAAFAEATRLGAAGDPPAGPVEVLVIRGGGLAGDGHGRWPLARPIEELAVAPDTAGAMTRVDDPADAAALRMLRKQATAYRVFVIVEEGGRAYRVYIRDAVPR